MRADVEIMTPSNANVITRCYFSCLELSLSKCETVIRFLLVGLPVNSSFHSAIFIVVHMLTNLNIRWEGAPRNQQLKQEVTSTQSQSFSSMIS